MTSFERQEWPLFLFNIGQLLVYYVKMLITTMLWLLITPDASPWGRVGTIPYFYTFYVWFEVDAVMIILLLHGNTIYTSTATWDENKTAKKHLVFVQFWILIFGSFYMQSTSSKNANLGRNLIVFCLFILFTLLFQNLINFLFL